MDDNNNNIDETLEAIMSREQIDAAQEQANGNQPQEQPAEAPQEQVPTEEQIPENVPPEGQAPVEQPTQPTQPAQPTAEQLIMQNQQLKAALEQLTQQNQQNAELAQSQAQAAEQNTVEQLIKPELNMEVIGYGTEDEISAEKERYQKAYHDYITQSETKPLEERLRAIEADREREYAISRLESDPDFYDFKEKRPIVEAYIERNPALKKLGQDAYTVAYLAVKGVDTVKNRGNQPSAQDVLSAVKSDPKTYNEVMKQLQAENVKMLNENDKRVPPIVASNGFSNSPANVPKTPSTLDEAFKLSLSDYYKYQ